MSFHASNISYLGLSQAGSVPSYGGNLPGVDYGSVDYPDSRVHTGHRARHPNSSAPFSDVNYPTSSNTHGNMFSARLQQQSQPINYNNEVFKNTFRFTRAALLT